MMKTSIDYLRYINSVNDNLSNSGLRLLTLEEATSIIGHLIKVVEAYPEEDVGGLDLMETLALETVKRAAELHPDMPTPTPERVEEAIDSMLMSERDG